MRRLAPLLLPLLLLGCPGPPSFLVRIDVTVPQDVQAAFSSTSPAMVMVGTSPLAELCDPTGVPFTVQYSRTVSGHHCPETFGTNATQVSVVALSQGDIDWFNANGPTVGCGQTRAINDQPSIDAIARRASAAS